MSVVYCNLGYTALEQCRTTRRSGGSRASEASLAPDCRIYGVKTHSPGPSGGCTSGQAAAALMSRVPRSTAPAYAVPHAATSVAK